ncbi:LacI family DNA-binding transcriptional regulator [Gryllotalpicola daejeonensis]|uniref:LacI family DNA-binding transcriptional regulator n=2 Tax=Gryllotalpicola daejeonensis TaxID=993087 RepID=A0ABP7ZP11_9MICO
MSEKVARSATIFDVARLAGVSHQTVSRVINSHPSVKPETRARVEEAILQLRYQPSPAARSLVTKRSRTIGLITSDAADYGPSMVANQFSDAARAARYAVMTVTVPEAQPSAARDAVEALLRQNVEAIVIVVVDVAVADLANAVETNTPIVFVDARRSWDPRSTGIDQYNGARLAVRHLLGLGFDTVAHVSGPVRNPDAIERIRGWADELAGAGAPHGLRLDGDWSPASGYAAGIELPVTPGETAVFAANDQMALGLIAALRSRGFSVPRDVSVVGFDDVPEAAYFQPPLTTVHQNFAALGRATMDRVVALLDEGEEPLEPRLIGARLSIRDSTTAAVPVEH